MFHLNKYRRAGLGWIALLPILLYFLLSSLQFGARTLEPNRPVEDFLEMHRPVSDSPSGGALSGSWRASFSAPYLDR